MTCSVEEITIMIHEGSAEAGSCPACLDNMGKTYATNTDTEPYRLPAHNLCKCSWNKTEITCISRAKLEALRSILNEVKAENANEESILDEQQLLMNATDAIVVAQQAIAADCLESEEYYREVADGWQAQYVAALDAIAEYQAIQAEQRALMDAADAIVVAQQAIAADCLESEEYYRGVADGWQAQYEAALDAIAEYQAIQAEQRALMDAADAIVVAQQAIAADALESEEYYLDLADGWQARYEAALDAIAEYQAIQAEQRALMDAADAIVVAQQALAADAFESEEYYLDLAAGWQAESDETMLLIAEYEDIQAEQQELMAEYLDIAEEAQGEAEAAYAEYQDYCDLADDWTALAEEANATASEYEDIQAEQQAIMTESEDIANDALDEAEAAYAESASWLDLCNDWLDLAEEAAILASLYEDIQAEQQELMDEYLNIAEEAQGEADAAYIAYNEYCNLAADWITLAEEANATASECEDIQAEQWDIMVECSAIANEALDEAEAAYLEANDYQDLGDENYDLGMEWAALGDEYYEDGQYDEADECYLEAEQCFDLAIECYDNRDFYNDLGNQAIQIAESALAEYDAAAVIYNAHDPTSLYADAATYLQNANDCLDQAEYYEGLGLEATAIVNEAMDNYDAAEAIYNAYDPAPLYADQATYTQNASDCMGQVDYYFALGNEATQIAEDALDEYNTAESIYNAYDPTSLYADAATYLENANDCLDQAEYYDGLGREAMAIVNEAMDNYDAAEAIYDAHDTTQLQADAATYLQNAQNAAAEADAYHEDYLDALQAAQNAMEDYIRAESIYDAHDTAQLQADAATYLQNAQNAAAQADAYHEDYLDALQAAQNAMEEYIRAESIYDAHDTTQLQADAATYLQNAQNAAAESDAYHLAYLAALQAAQNAMEDYIRAESIYDAHDTTELEADAATFFQNARNAAAEADAYHEDYLDALQDAQNAMEEYIKAEYYFDAALDSLDIKEQSDTYSKCLEYPITEEVVSNYNAIWIGD
jgi:mannose/fructose/N-acetylgalactosamine-specific phosphotransferase system component IIB